MFPYNHMFPIFGIEIGGKIFDKIQDKGWNIYDTQGIDKFGDHYVVENNLVSKLEIGNTYIMYPITKEPNNPKIVLEALDTVTKGIDSRVPTIKINNYHETEFTRFRISTTHAKIICPEGLELPYPQFIRALDSIVNANILTGREIVVNNLNQE
ncbi:hypothetical protein KY321_02100 [Candidatus Woesearchaeota archaeon]|nr:hypothetical protein [Candidatus Woesearchaeota archaeon]